MTADQDLQKSAPQPGVKTWLLVMGFIAILTGAVAPWIASASDDDFFVSEEAATYPESMGAAAAAIGDDEAFQRGEDPEANSTDGIPNEFHNPKIDYSNIPIPTPRPDQGRDRNRLDSMLQLVPTKIHDKLRNSGIPSVPLARALDFRQRMIDEGENINRDQLVVSDLTVENNKDRMWLINLKTGKVQAFRTAHGSGGREKNGGNGLICAHRFGNLAGSLTTPGGAFVFGCPYTGSKIPRLRRSIGSNRRSVWMIGMDEANENSARRAVIFHEGYSINSGALYTDNSGGGRSSGCLTIKPSAYQSFEDIIKQPRGCPKVFPTKPAGGAPVYIYPEKGDVLASNPVYWDVQCAETLRKQRKKRQYLE